MYLRMWDSCKFRHDSTASRHKLDRSTVEMSTKSNFRFHPVYFNHGECLTMVGVCVTSGSEVFKRVFRAATLS